MVLFQVTARTVLHALMLKKAACPCPFKALLPVTQSALIGQLTQAWTSSINDSRAAVLEQFLCEKPAARQKLWPKKHNRSNFCFVYSTILNKTFEVVILGSSFFIILTFYCPMCIDLTLTL